MAAGGGGANSEGGNGGENTSNVSTMRIRPSETAGYGNPAKRYEC